MAILHRINFGYDSLEQIEVGFREEDVQLLEEFIAQARRVEQCSLAQSRMPSALKIELNQRSDSYASVTLPNWEHVEVFLHRMRPIILKNERTNFYKICNILSRNIPLSRAREQVKEERELYEGARIHGVVQVYSQEELLTSDRVLQDYLNGFEYHRDKDRQERLARLNGFLPLEAQRVLWYWLLLEKGASAIRVAEWTRHLCDAIRETETPPLNVGLLAMTSS